jgi:hypothetical protein
MADRTARLQGMAAPEAVAREAHEGRRSSFDPPRYFTTVHVPGYNVLTSIVAARRRHRRRAAVRDIREQTSASPAEPCGAPIASIDAYADVGPPTGSRHAK